MGGQVGDRLPLDRLFLPNYHIQDLFCKGDNDPAGQGQKTIRPLAGIMRLHRQAHLHDAKSQQDQSNGSDQAEDEIGQVIDCLDRISCCIADAGA